MGHQDDLGTLLAGEGHIPLSCTPEPESAAPITGATPPDPEAERRADYSRAKGQSLLNSVNILVELMFK